MGHPQGGRPRAAIDRTGGLTLACCGPPGSLEAASRAGGSSSPAPMQLLAAAVKALLSVSAAAAVRPPGPGFPQNMNNHDVS